MIVLLGIFSIAFLSLTFCSSESGICFTGSPPILSDMLSSESVLLYMMLVSVYSWKSSLLNKFLLNPKIQEVTRTYRWLIQMYKVTHVLMQLSWEKLCLPSWLCWPGASPYQIRVQQKARRWLEQLCVTCNNMQWVRTQCSLCHCSKHCCWSLTGGWWWWSHWLLQHQDNCCWCSCCNNNWNTTWCCCCCWPIYLTLKNDIGIPVLWTNSTIRTTTSPCHILTAP